MNLVCGHGIQNTRGAKPLSTLGPAPHSGVRAVLLTHSECDVRITPVLINILWAKTNFVFVSL